MSQSTVDKLNQVDAQFNEVYLQLGQLAVLAEMIDTSALREDWRASEGCQAAIALCHEKARMTSQMFNDAHDLFQESKMELG